MEKIKVGVMKTQDMIEIVEKRLEKSLSAREKVDGLYDNTIRMLNAIEQGRSEDVCLKHWVSLIDPMEGYSNEEKEYYTAHASGLVFLIEDFVKARTKI